MKRNVLLLVLTVMSPVVFASNYVDWNGGDHGWMDGWDMGTYYWTDEAPAPDWNIPGWVVNNPANPGTWTSTSNLGLARISNGTARITPTSKPDGRVTRIVMGKAAGDVSTLELSADVGITQVYIANTADTTATINQTAGTTTIYSTATFGQANADCTYNVSGTSSLVFVGHANLASGAGSDCTFNLNGGSISTAPDVASREFAVGRNGSAQLNINLGSVTVNNDNCIYVGRNSGSSGIINLSDGGSLTHTGATALEMRCGHEGTGVFNQTGGTSSLLAVMLGRSKGNGTYNLSGGSATISGDLAVGRDGVGVMNITGNDASISVGGLHIGAYDVYAGDGTLDFSVAADGVTAIAAQSVVLDAAGDSSIANLIVSLMGVSAPMDDILLIDNLGTGAVSGIFDSFNGGSAAEGTMALLGGNTYELTYMGGTGNDVVLEYVPEPTTIALLALGGLMAATRRKKR